QCQGAHSIKQPTTKLERRSVWWGISHPPTVLLPTSCTRPAREVRDGTDPHRGGFHHQYGCPHRSVAPTLSYSPTRALDRACLPVRSTPGYSVPSRHPSPLVASASVRAKEASVSEWFAVHIVATGRLPLFSFFVAFVAGFLKIGRASCRERAE